MTIDIKIFQILFKMPDSLKQEILHYAEYLLEKYGQPESPQDPSNRVRGYGSWVGQIVMSDDFDRPLEDLDDYM